MKSNTEEGTIQKEKLIHASREREHARQSEKINVTNESSYVTSLEFFFKCSASGA